MTQTRQINISKATETTRYKFNGMLMTVLAASKDPLISLSDKVALAGLLGCSPHIPASREATSDQTPITIVATQPPLLVLLAGGCEFARILAM